MTQSKKYSLNKFHHHINSSSHQLIIINSTHSHHFLLCYREMNTKNFLNHLELLYEERLVEKTSLNIKIIEVNIVDIKFSKKYFNHQVVCETYGQLIVQSVVLLRLKTLIQTDYFNYFGISFEVIIMMSMVISILSLFTTFWSYHTRSKQRFR